MSSTQPHDEHSVHQDAHASDSGHVYQAAGNQHISHNENHGAARTVFQVGAVHGNVVVLPQSPARSAASEAQLVLAGHLAGEVRALSAQEVEQWGIRGPDALLVRWHTAAEDLLDRWENIHDEPGRDEPMSLDGRFTAIRDTYQAIRSKRLVILGKAGAGKTVLAHRLILDLVDNAGVTGPVPVLFSLSDWNPAVSGLRSWLVQQLLRDFPFLDARDPATGKSGAEGLVDRELILPILDGFDEIADRHHRAAIREISNVDWPLVVTSRPDQYAQAARTVKAVGRAAAIELEDLSLDEAHRYLRQSTSRTRTPAWDTVFDRLHTTPEDTASRNLTPVLRTPLMVMLARTTYNDSPGHDPRQLLDTHRFPTDTALEEHLLNTYLTTVYDRHDHETGHPNWTPERARHWLGYLATHLTQRSTHDLTWWQLPATLHRHTRILLTTITVALTYLLTSVLTYGLWAVLRYGLAYGLAAGLTVGLLFGLPAGLMFGLLNETRFSRRGGREPERLHLRVRRRSRTQRSPTTYLKKTAGEFAVGLAVGLAVRLAVGLADELASGSAHSWGLAAGLTIGLMYGLVNVVVSILGDSHGPHTTNPWTLLTRDRTVTIVRTIAAALVFGFAVGLTDGFTATLTAGLTDGLVLGLIGGTGRLMLSAWGNWLLFARLWLPLTCRLPWRPKRFLEDAYQRGVLRRAGAVYQFHHARLRDHLTTHHQTKPHNRRS